MIFFSMGKFVYRKEFQKRIGKFKIAKSTSETGTDRVVAESTHGLVHVPQWAKTL